MSFWGGKNNRIMGARYQETEGRKTERMWHYKKTYHHNERTFEINFVILFTHILLYYIHLLHFVTVLCVYRIVLLALQLVGGLVLDVWVKG